MGWDGPEAQEEHWYDLQTVEPSIYWMQSLTSDREKCNLGEMNMC